MSIYTQNNKKGFFFTCKIKSVKKNIHCRTIWTFCFIPSIISILFLYSQTIISIISRYLFLFSLRILISARTQAYRRTSKILNWLVFLLSNFPAGYQSWYTIYYLKHGKRKIVKLHTIFLSHSLLALTKKYIYILY